MRQEGFDYHFEPSACESCGGRCCTGESGNIFATTKEFEIMAEHLKLSMGEFIENYLLKVGNRFSLQEVRYNDSYDCIFFDRTIGGCTVYEVRPTQCRTFPFWDYFKTYPQDLATECPGITFDKINKENDA